MTTYKELLCEDNLISDEKIVFYPLEESKDLSTVKAQDNLSNITIFEAKNINLFKIHSSIFFCLRNLTFLDLKDNKLLKIPKKMAFLTQLKVLKLDNNRIEMVPSHIENLHSLELLSLNGNQISYISPNISKLTNLTTLKLSNNRIDNIPIELGQLKKLEVLHIDVNYFTEIPTTLCYLKQLNELALEWNEFVDPPYNRILRDNLGKTVISLIRKILHSLLQKGKIDCNFNTFVSKLSSSSGQVKLKNSKSDKNLRKSKDETLFLSDNKSQTNKFFLTIENKYFGVFKVYL